MFTPEERNRLRSELIEAARADARLTGGAITGSGAVGQEDAWSDIDLGFGVGDATRMSEVLADWTSRMYERHGALHHLDVVAGSWIYRVFLLASTLQVDLAFVPAAEFAARIPTFRLVFGNAAERPHVSPPDSESLIGYAWLYALHARSSLARGRLWQAEYMVSAMRDQVLALACLRYDLPAHEGRGLDRLPIEVTRPLEETLAQRIDPVEISRAFQALVQAFLAETRIVVATLADRIEPTLLELSTALGPTRRRGAPDDS